MEYKDFAQLEFKTDEETAEICRKYIPLDLILAAIKSQEKQKDGI